MHASLSRRHFLRRTSLLTAGLVTFGAKSSLRAAKSPNDKVLVAVIGCNGRGTDHIAGYLALPNVELAYDGLKFLF